MERWYGTLRGPVVPLRRRTRCLSWLRDRHRRRVWVLVSLYNFVMPHKSLRQGHTPRTPAMAIGLTDHVWSYREYIGLPVHPDPVLRQQMEARITQLLTPGTSRAAARQYMGEGPSRRGKREKGRWHSEGSLRCSLLFFRTTRKCAHEGLSCLQRILSVDDSRVFPWAGVGWLRRTGDLFVCYSTKTETYHEERASYIHFHPSEVTRSSRASRRASGPVSEFAEETWIIMGRIQCR